MSFPPCVSLSRPVSGTGARRAAAASTFPRALLAAAADAPTANGVPRALVRCNFLQRVHD